MQGDDIEGDSFQRVSREESGGSWSNYLLFRQSVTGGSGMGEGGCGAGGWYDTEMRDF